MAFGHVPVSQVSSCPLAGVPAIVGVPAVGGGAGRRRAARRIRAARRVVERPVRAPPERAAAEVVERAAAAARREERDDVVVLRLVARADERHLAGERGQPAHGEHVELRPAWSPSASISSAPPAACVNVPDVRVPGDDPGRTAPPVFVSRPLIVPVPAQRAAGQRGVAGERPVDVDGPARDCRAGC